jgi:aspartyl/asparaginyl-tRNA synthetase
MQALGLNNHLANLDGPNINQIKDKYIGLTARIHRVLARTPDGIATLLLRHDGRFFNCLLAPGFTDSDSLLTALDVTAESLVRVSGEIVSENEPVKHESCSQPTIIRLKTLAVLSGAKADLTQTVASHDFPDTPVSPMEPSAATLDERLDNRLLEARVAANTAIFKLFSGVHELAVGYLAAFNFHYVPTPSLIGYEFPGEEHEQFAVPYFDNQSVWLAQTGEMHLGMALAADLERVYDIHTVFRREELPGPRHLTEVRSRFLHVKTN